MSKPKKITVHFDPKVCGVIPSIQGQSRRLPDGTMECWFTKEQGEYALLMAERLKQALEEDTPTLKGDAVSLPAPK